MTKLARTDDQKLLSVLISLTVESDYRNRGAFPGLRLDTALKRSGTTLHFRVPLDFAQEVLEDAQNRRDEIGGGRGLYQSYRALAQGLKRLLDDAEGVRPDPGRENWVAEMQTANCHAIGARLLGDEGEALTITQGYGLHYVIDSDGEFRDEKGQRFSWRVGYVCRRADDSRTYFYAAGDLYDQSGGVTHLRLVPAGA